MKAIVLVSAALAFASGAALGQPPHSPDADALYRQGLSARQLLDAPLRDARGETVGEVQDIVLDRGGNIRQLVVELGKQSLHVPWRDVSIGEDMEFVQVALRELPRDEDAVPGAWRVNELIGDYARLADESRYGLVTDVIFSERGEATAVIVERDRAWGGAGHYAFPFAAFDRAAAEYALPYQRDELVLLEPFDYLRLDRQSVYAGR